QRLALPRGFIEILVRLGLERDAIYVVPAIGLLAEQLEFVLALLGSGEWEQVGRDSVARMAVVGQIFGEAIDQFAIDIHVLVFVSGSIVGNVFALVLVASFK